MLFAIICFNIAVIKSPKHVYMKHSKTIFILLLYLISSQLVGQATDSIPASVVDFYGDSATSNKVHEFAPVETVQFGQLAGIWYCTGFMQDPLGKVDTVPYEAYWAWKYILDGYAVQDYFFQGKNEFRYWDYFKRGTSLTQLRVFDTKESQWKIAFITDNGGKMPGRFFGTFTAKMQDGELIMEPSSQNPDKLSRIVFYDMGENSFEWRSESSEDAGKTWIVTIRLSGKRLQ